MRFLISVFLISLGTYFLQLLLPWYAISIMPFMVGLILPKKAPGAFIHGFFGVALLWGLLSYLIHYQNSGILTDILAKLLYVGSPILVILATAVLGGIVGGLWCMVGFYVKKLFSGRQRKSGRYEFS